MELITTFVALLLTGLFYSLFPLLYSALRKKSITKKKYLIFVLVETVSVLIAFGVIYLALNSNSSPKLSAAIIWGNVSYYLGLVILKRNNKLAEENAQFPPPSSHLENGGLQTPIGDVNYCHKCGNRLTYGSLYCNKCGEKIVGESE